MDDSCGDVQGYLLGILGNATRSNGTILSFALTLFTDIHMFESTAAYHHSLVYSWLVLRPHRGYASAQCIITIAVMTIDNDMDSVVWSSLFRQA